MEVYKITCKINNKIYIGSTKLTKEKRWGDLSSSSSHLSEVRDGTDTPLYNDIRKYGKENFILETIEIVEGNRHETYKREDYWIKKYWDKYGEEMIYNQFRGSHGNKNWSIPHNPEMQKKAAMIRKQKYGTSNAKMITKEAIEKAKQTKLKRYGSVSPLLSIEARNSQIRKISYKILDTLKNKIIIGYKEVFNELKEENYNITYWQTKRILENNNCKRILTKYPELKNRFKILGKNND